MLIKQSIESASIDVRGAASLPDATGGIVVANKADSTKDELPERRSRTMTEKGKSFRLSTLKERRDKCSVTEEEQHNCGFAFLHKKLGSSRRTCSVQ